MQRGNVPGFTSLSNDMMLVLFIVTLTLFLSISNFIRIDVVLVLVVIGITRLLPPEQLFSGFSSEAVISLIAGCRHDHLILDNDVNYDKFII